MTDIHLRPEKQAIRGFNSALKMIALLKPDFVIAGGDQIDDALEQNYQRAHLLYSLYQKSISKLAMPVYHVLGNHDIFGIYKKSGISNNHPEFGKKMFVSRLNQKYYSFNHKGWCFFILDSIIITEKNSYQGGIDQKQLEWLRLQLARTDRKTPIILATHIPFFSIMPQIDKRFKPEKFLLKNPLQALKLFKDHNLKLVLQGHVHHFESIQSQGIWFVSGGAISGNWWDGQLYGTEEGFVLLTVEGENISWDYIDYGWQAKPDTKRFKDSR